MRTIGIDTGGTFTDLIEIRDEGEIRLHKVPSTPRDFARGVLSALDRSEDGRDNKVASLSLGTTIATNAFLTRSGARVGFLTTAGHGDTLKIMRIYGRVAGLPSTVMQSYADTDKPAPIVPSALVREIVERVDWRGEVVVPLDEDQAVESLQSLLASGAEIVAVSFLWSFVNPRHERRIREIARNAFPGLDVILSSEVVPKLGEYERSVSTAVNAYVSPVMTRFLDRVEDGLIDHELSAPMLVMHSSGGVGTGVFTRRHAITTLFSGPAGGVIGAQRVGEQLGHRDIICTDMGGTSFDVGLVLDGRPLLRTTTTIDQHVMFLPSIDIVSIGAGGGSLISATDARLHVGPESAGADPGPACYARGGERPTLTDVNVVLGYIDPHRFVGGRMKLDAERARMAVARHVADPLGMTVEAAAAAAFTVANARMTDLVRKVTVERGFDPRDFTLFAYGGLGPLHAPFFSTDLDVHPIVVPLGQISSVFSAYGIAVSDLLHVYQTSRVLAAPFDAEELEHTFSTMEDRAKRQLSRDGIPEPERRIHRFLEMRYQGQFSEISVPIKTGPLRAPDSDEIVADFEKRYLSTFGAGSLWSEGKVEIAAFRIEAIGLRRVPVAGRDPPSSPASAPCIHSREMYWPTERRFLSTPVLHGDSLPPAEVLSGPAAVDLTTTTALVPPGWTCTRDLSGTLALSPSEDGGTQRRGAGECPG